MFFTYTAHLLHAPRGNRTHPFQLSDARADIFEE
jgi:hypothetical protein